MRSRASFDRLDELPCLLCCSVKYELKEVLLAINEQKQLSMQHQWLPRLVQLAHASSKGVFHKLHLLIKLSQRAIYGPINLIPTKVMGYVNHQEGVESAPTQVPFKQIHSPSFLQVTSLASAVQWLRRWTSNSKVPSSNPGANQIFFSRKCTLLSNFKKKRRNFFFWIFFVEFFFGNFFSEIFFEIFLGIFFLIYFSENFFWNFFFGKYFLEFFFLENFFWNFCLENFFFRNFFFPKQNQEMRITNSRIMKCGDLLYTFYWKKKDLVPPGFEQGTSGFEVQRLNHWTAEARLETRRKLGECICLKGTCVGALSTPSWWL